MMTDLITHCKNVHLIPALFDNHCSTTKCSVFNVSADSTLELAQVCNEFNGLRQLKHMGSWCQKLHTNLKYPQLL